MVSFQPFGNRVALRISDSEENVGGIIVAVSKEKSNKGIVVAVGDGDDVKNLNIGDVVIFAINSGVSYATGTESYKVVEVRDIIGKIIGE